MKAMTGEQKPVMITLECLSGFSDNGRDNMLLQIVRHLKQLFETRMRAENLLVIPSVADLATFYGCSPLDILDAFYELRRQGYAYEMDDLYRPVVFQDVLGSRQPKVQQKATAGKGFSSLAKFSDLLRQKFA